MPLPGVLRLLFNSKQTGALVVADGNFRGSIYLRLGRLIHAEIAQGATGLDALLQFTRHPAASFHFETGVAPAEESLAAVPTLRLLEKLTKEVETARAIATSVPFPNDRPLYRASGANAGIEVQASPEEFNLLLYANGERTVEQIAQMVGWTVQQVQVSIAKFRGAGIVVARGANPPPVPPPPAEVEPETDSDFDEDEEDPGEEPPPPPPPPTEGPAPASGGHAHLPMNPSQPTLQSHQEKAPRYWRGRRID